MSVRACTDIACEAESERLTGARDALTLPPLPDVASKLTPLREELEVA
jgi:hypothetical protein